MIPSSNLRQQKTACLFLTNVTFHQGDKLSNMF